LQQDLVNLSLLHAFSIAKLASISIKAKSNSAMLIDLPTSQQSTVINFNDGSSQFIVKYIYSLDSERAQDIHSASTCKESFILIDASDAEGVRASTNIQAYRTVKITALRLRRNKDFQFIVESDSQKGQQNDSVVGVNPKALLSFVRARTSIDMFNYKSLIVILRKRAAPHIKKVHSKLIAQIIGVLNSEGARAPLTTFPTLHNRKIELIVASPFSKTFLHFGKGFAIFCEEDRENANNGNDAEDDESNSPSLLLLASTISTQGALDASDPKDTLAAAASLILLFLVGLVGIGLFGPANIAKHTVPNSFDKHIGLVNLMKPIGLVGLGHFSLVGRCISGLIGFDGFNGFGSLALSASAPLLTSQLRSLFGIIGRFGLLSHVNRISLVGSIGFRGISGLLANQISLINLSDLAIISLVGSLASFVCRLISLIGLGNLGLNSLVCSSASFARQLIGLVSLIGLSIHRLFCNLLTAVVIAVKTIGKIVKIYTQLKSGFLFDTP
jgi:hypothetical protein